MSFQESLNYVEKLIQQPEQLAVVLEDAIDWAHCFGLVLRTPEHKDRSDHCQTAPLALFPSPFPRKLFDQAMNVQEMKCSPQERSKCVEWFIQEGNSVVSFQKRYRREFRAVNCDVTAPNANRIKEWYAKFQEGDLKNKKRVGTKYLRTPEKTAEFNALPHASQRWTANL